MSKNSKGMPNGLTEFQVDIAKIFFALPESSGFLLAGGAALIVHGLVERPTQDLDFFTSQHGGNIIAAAEAFEDAARQRNWVTHRVRESASFIRISIIGRENLAIDFAIDSAPERSPVISIIGPTFEPEELAGRKLVALFDRAEARDFTDVYILAQRYGKEKLLRRAKEIDQGFDKKILAEMFQILNRFSDDELPVKSSQLLNLRNFFANWANELHNEA